MNTNSQRRAASLDELSELVALIPPHLRESMLSAALQFRPAGASFEEACSIGVIRAAIAAVLESHFPDDWEQRWELLRHGDPMQRAERMRAFVALRRKTSIRRQLSAMLLETGESPHARQ